MGTTDAETNDKMARTAPELASVYAKYPLRKEYWLDVNGKLDENTPAFIPYKKDPHGGTPPLKKDYVWGPGSRTWGYYHILTREAYVTINGRLSNIVMIDCCCLGTPEQKFSDEVIQIVYNRSIASKPDDFLAMKEALELARGISIMHYNQTQGNQLVHLAFSVATQAPGFTGEVKLK